MTLAGLLNAVRERPSVLSGPGSPRFRTTRVVIDGGRVIKSGYVNFDAELEKAESLARSASGSMFDAPRVLEARADSCSIVFEYLPGLVSVRNAYLAACRHLVPIGPVSATFSAVGRALARIHEHVHLSSVVPWIPSLQFRQELMREGCGKDIGRAASGGDVVLHGDFGFANVFVRGSDGSRLAVLDPSPNHFTTSAANETGPRAVDLANMISCIQGLVPIQNYPAMDWAVARQLAESFLSGYEAESGSSVSRECIFAVGRAVARTYFRYRYHWRPLELAATRAFGWHRKKAVLHYE